MNADIVDTLRRNPLYIPTSRINSFGRPQMGFELTSFNLIAADEIERLRNDLDGSQLAYRGASYDRDRMRTERDEGVVEIERLRAGGCARDQKTTQYCAEAVTLQELIEQLRRERDDARWRLCKVLGDIREVWGDEIATEKGWRFE